MFKSKHITGFMAATALSTFSIPAGAQSIEELKAQLEMLSKRIEELEKKQEEASSKKTAEAKKSEPAFPLSIDDGLFEFNIRGRVIADAGWASDADGTMDLAATELRGARIGVEGKAWKNVKYKMEADFVGNEVNVTDAFIEYAASFGKIKFGQFKTQNSLEEITSGLNMTFIERTSFTDAFDIARMIGINYANGGDNWTFNAGVFRGNNSLEIDKEGQAYAARLTYGDHFDGGTWIVGASIRHRDVGNGSLLRYRQRPHHHLSEKFLATDRIAQKDTMYTFEAAAQYGAFHVSAEYAGLNADKAGSRGRDAYFSGGSIEAGWFITGESKPLNLKKAVWDRPKVNNPMHKGGMGAWQIAARYDVLDLTDNGVFGGEQDTIVLGLNWYFNRHTRVMMNYSHSSIEDAFDVEENGPDGKNSIDTYGMRFQIDW